MTIVSGQIEPLKRLKETLNNNGIYRFNSIGDINTFLKNHESEKKDVSAVVESVLDEEIRNIDQESKQAIKKSNKHILNKIFYYLKVKRLIKTHAALVNNYENTISKRCADAYHDLEFIKETIENLYSLIAGAVGENSVVNELQKLPDIYYLINDFSLNFNPPIFNKRENDRIYSIQIDHLLCQAGVFVLETKN